MKKIASILLAFAIVLSIVGIPTKANAMSTNEYIAFAKVFDADYYYAAYPDVAATCGPNYGKLLSHFMTTGMYEGRSASLEFNPSYYKNRYPDLQAVYGDDLRQYCIHYASCGKAEGRIGNGKNAPNPDTTGLNLNVNFTNSLVVASRTTKYNAKIGRATNVSLATKAIDGTILMPGEQFSYNKVVGPRTSARGYVEATVYNSGEVTTGIGGGICQVSSTLYAATKDCGLPATERHAHSLPVHYLPAGYDATVAYGSLDFKFVNAYQYPLMIKGTAVDGNLTIDLILLQP